MQIGFSKLGRERAQTTLGGKETEKRKAPGYLIKCAEIFSFAVRFRRRRSNIRKRRN